MKAVKTYPAIILMIIISAYYVNAENNTEHEKEGHGHEGTAHGHALHHNHLGIFIGPTTNLDKEATDFSLGLDYEFRFSDSFGAGIFGEHIFNSHSPWLAGAGLFYHPAGGLKFFAAAGLEYVPANEEHDTEHIKVEIPGKTDKLLASEEETGEAHSEFLIRLGLGYDFHVRQYYITPTFNVDIVAGHVSLVYGISFGIGF